MMKPQDLMVGDLISMGGVIRVVTGIHDKETENGVDLITTMIPGHTFPDSNLSFRASYCYPIQITPEILEKNFGKAINGGYFEGDEFYELFIHEVTDGTWIIKHDNIEFSNIPRQQVMVSYVHELQHALRICGIEKEIDLC